MALFVSVLFVGCKSVSVFYLVEWISPMVVALACISGIVEDTEKCSFVICTTRLRDQLCCAYGYLYCGDEGSSLAVTSGWVLKFGS